MNPDNIVDAICDIIGEHQSRPAIAALIWTFYYEAYTEGASDTSSQMLRLSPRDSQILARSLLNPPSPNKALRELIARQKELKKKGGG